MEVITTTETTPGPDAHLQEAATRRADATRVIGPVTDALDLIPSLCAGSRRLRRWLARTCTHLRNLTPAARATPTTHSDGEPDALCYLRDELHPACPGSSPPDLPLTCRMIKGLALQLHCGCTVIALGRIAMPVNCNYGRIQVAL